MTVSRQPRCRYRAKLFSIDKRDNVVLNMLNEYVPWFPQELLSWCQYFVSSANALDRWAAKIVFDQSLWTQISHWKIQVPIIGMIFGIDQKNIFDIYHIHRHIYSMDRRRALASNSRSLCLKRAGTRFWSIVVCIFCSPTEKIPKRCASEWLTLLNIILKICLFSFASESLHGTIAYDVPRRLHCRHKWPQTTPNADVTNVTLYIIETLLLRIHYYLTRYRNVRWFKGRRCRCTTNTTSTISSTTINRMMSLANLRVRTYAMVK